MSALNLLTPPAVEPVTLAQAKSFLRVDLVDDDLLIGGLIASARQYCENATNRAFMTQTYQLIFDAFPFGGGYYNRANRARPTLRNYLPSQTGDIKLPRPPFQSMVGITYLDLNGDSQTLPSSTYRVISGNQSATRLTTAALKTWPIAYPIEGAVTITWIAGYSSDPAALPPTVATPILQLVSHWYNHRDAVSEGTMTVVPHGVDALLDCLQWGGS